MDNTQNLPKELAFLSWVFDISTIKYETAFWLLSDFHDDVWTCKFVRSTIKIRWNAKLPDGHVLSEEYKVAVLTFKTWLVVQTHRDVTGGKINLPIVSYHRVSEVLRLIDFLILNNARYGVLEHGISTLTATDFKSILSKICSFGNSADSVYQWKENLTYFAKKSILEIPLSIKEKILVDVPDLSKIDVIHIDRLLDLSDEEIIFFRAWLWWKQFYKCHKRGEFRFFVPTKELVELIYSGTIWASHTNFPLVPELFFSPIERYSRECSAVAVRTSLENKASHQRLKAISNAIKSLGLLKNVGLAISLDALDEFSKDGWLSTIDVKPAGRFSMIPQSVVLHTLQKSIDFVLNIGDELIDACLKIVTNANQIGLEPQEFCNEHDIQMHLGEKLRNMGVQTWSLGLKILFEESNPNKPLSDRVRANVYFSRLRSNEGLFELIQVLFGSIQISVGILSARRQAELIELYAHECLDSDEKYLIFHNRKSGISGMRERELRPIPPIVVRMIKLLQRLQTSLQELGVLSKPTNLFSMPRRQGQGFLTVSPGSYNRLMDRACDYFEIESDENGDRYYLRQHLLRRFFATLFFWGKSFGGMDTLRWFLGHTDIQHLYHYITESTPGAVLRWTKALYVSEELKRNTSGLNQLTDMLENKFHTRDFSLLDANELTEYIDAIIEDGTITVEPYFFHAKEGQDFKIVVKLLERN